MNKKIILTMIIIVWCFMLAGCHLKHEWQEATCTEPRTCTVGGETEGEPLGHIWEEATCTEPKTCSVCGATEGKSLGHEWIKATCTEAKTCSVCGETEGKALGHKWQKATCQIPKTCSVCGITEGKVGDHTVGIPATYWSTAVCSVCGNAFGEVLTPYFVNKGIEINAFPDNTYETESTTFTYYNHRKVPDGDYTLVRGTVFLESIFLDPRFWFKMEDYYTGTAYKNMKDNDDITLIYSTEFSIDYNGREYDNCYGKIYYSGSGHAVYFYYELYIPTGYDGVVLYLNDNENESTGLRLRME